MEAAAAVIATRVRRAPLTAVVAGSIALLALLVATGAPGVLRVPVSLAVLATAAGLSWAPVLRLGDGREVPVVVLGISLAVDVLLATALMYLGLTVSAPGGLIALTLVCAAGCALQLAGPATDGTPGITPGSGVAAPGRAAGSPDRPGGTAPG